MAFDPPTLFGLSGLVGTTAGVLLLFFWLHDRRVAALALWGSAFVLVSLGSALVVTRANAADVWSSQVGPVMTLTGYGLMWCGARSFEGRSLHFPLAVLGAVVWLAAMQVDAFVGAPALRMRLSSATIVIYSLATAAEYWRARDPGLISRWPAIALLLVHAAFFALRFALVEAVPFPGGSAPADPKWVPVGAVSLLLHVVCLAFLVMNMARERAELQQRRQAHLDPLTGVANRRGFLDRGERTLRRCVADKEPAAVLIVDLDLFKQINDTLGHQAGDHVLCVFCETANTVLRPNDVFGRLGGEEFACLLPGASAAEALQVAERIRASFEDRRDSIPMRHGASTVSVGVATTLDVAADLETLMAAADRAVYLAKAKGRNRVEQATAAA